DLFCREVRKRLHPVPIYRPNQFHDRWSPIGQEHDPARTVAYPLLRQCRGGSRAWHLGHDAAWLCRDGRRDPAPPVPLFAPSARLKPGEKRACTWLGLATGPRLFRASGMPFSAGRPKDRPACLRTTPVVFPATTLLSRERKLLHIQRNIPLDKVRVSSFSS